jgi:hypothetical protein
MTEITKGFNVPLKGREPLETGRRRVTFGQAAVEKNCLLPMASSRGLQASNDAKCFHGHLDSGSPRVRGKLAQPASRRRATSYLEGSPEKRVPEDRPQSAIATFQPRASGHAPRRSTCLERGISSAFGSGCTGRFLRRLAGCDPESTDPIQQA